MMLKDVLNNFKGQPFKLDFDGGIAILKFNGGQWEREVIAEVGEDFIAIDSTGPIKKYIVPLQQIRIEIV